MIPGIDVSDYQGTVDWAAVARGGQQFAFAKATEGTGFVCESFADNWAGIRAAGMVRGAYHFAQPSVNAANDEADHFLSTVGALEAGDLLALDLEVGDDPLLDWTLAWLDRVRRAVGFRPILYTGNWFLDLHPTVTGNDLAQYGLWLAQYTSQQPPVPPNWPFWALWQYTDSANVSGVDGPCDASFFNGAIGQLRLYGKPATATPATSMATVTIPANGSGPGDYLVRPGDTFTAIAAGYGCSLAALEQANPQIVNPNRIVPGDAVHLPPRNGAVVAGPNQTYVVRRGDSLSAIAARFGVSLLGLERANPKVTNPDLIETGEVLTVPTT